VRHFPGGKTPVIHLNRSAKPNIFVVRRQLALANFVHRCVSQPTRSVSPVHQLPNVISPPPVAGPGACTDPNPGKAGVSAIGYNSVLYWIPHNNHSCSHFGFGRIFALRGTGTVSPAGRCGTHDTRLIESPAAFLAQPKPERHAVEVFQCGTVSVPLLCDSAPHPAAEHGTAPVPHGRAKQQAVADCADCFNIASVRHRGAGSVPQPAADHMTRD
jgi:hypothetical protein